MIKYIDLPSPKEETGVFTKKVGKAIKMSGRSKDKRPVIKVAYKDFWVGFDQETNHLFKIISRDFDLVENDDDPDVVFCSVFGKRALEYERPRIQFIGEAVSCDFTNYDYIISGFDRISYPERYLRMPFPLLHFPERGTISLTREKHLFPDSFYEAKDRFCSFVYSNPDNSSGRYDFFKMLDQRKHVDSGGRCMNNMGGVNVDDKLEFQRRYRFDITFENTIRDDYVTEKITDAFAAGCIPIYLGDPSVDLDFNKDAFINVNDFASFEECIDYILYVDEHPEVYQSMIRTQAFVDGYELDRTYEEDLLRFLHSILDKDPIPRKVDKWEMKWNRPEETPAPRKSGGERTLEKIKKIFNRR